jgi:hypothetical protein
MNIKIQVTFIKHYLFCYIENLHLIVANIIADFIPYRETFGMTILIA